MSRVNKCAYQISLTAYNHLPLVFSIVWLYLLIILIGIYYSLLCQINHTKHLVCISTTVKSLQLILKTFKTHSLLGFSCLMPLTIITYAFPAKSILHHAKLWLCLFYHHLATTIRQPRWNEKVSEQHNYKHRFYFKQFVISFNQAFVYLQSKINCDKSTM